MYNTMATSYDHVMTQDAHQGIRLDRLVMRFETLMKALEGRGNIKHTVGRDF